MTEAESTEPQTLLALPAPTDATDAQKVEFNSEAIAKLSFDKLGPMVVNSDGVSATDNPITLCTALIVQLYC